MRVDLLEDLLLGQVLDLLLGLLVEGAVVAPQLQDAELEARRRHFWKIYFFSSRLLISREVFREELDLNCIPRSNYDFLPLTALKKSFDHQDV